VTEIGDTAGTTEIGDNAGTTEIGKNCWNERGVKTENCTMLCTTWLYIYNLAVHLVAEGVFSGPLSGILEGFWLVDLPELGNIVGEGVVGVRSRQ